MRYPCPALLVFSVIGVSAAVAQPPSRTNIPKAPDDVIFETDIAYRDGHDRWVLNVIRPRRKVDHPRAAIVLVHGGGWTGGTHYGFSRRGFMLAQQGYVVILPTYRMIKDGPFPACLHDVKNAIRWLRANAKKYNVDPDRVGAYGNSAGGTLALTVALTTNEADLEGDGSYHEFSSELQAVVCSGAVGDMRHEHHSRRAAAVYRNLAGALVRGTTQTQIESVMRQASPSSYHQQGCSADPAGARSKGHRRLHRLDRRVPQTHEVRRSKDRVPSIRRRHSRSDEPEVASNNSGHAEVLQHSSSQTR